MNNIMSLEDLKNRIEYLRKRQEECIYKAREYNNKMFTNPGSKSMYKKYMNDCYKESEKCLNEIEELEHQISVGGRKLKTALAVSKDLSKAGFMKATYNASSMVRGWGTWSGEFSVKNEPTKIIVSWHGRKENLEKMVNYLKEKYQNDFSIDMFNNITIHK